VLLGIIVESCATRIFLTNPDMDQDLYRRQFRLYGTAVEWSATLLPKRQFLIRTPELAKVPISMWIAVAAGSTRMIPIACPTEYSNQPVLAAIAEDAGDPGRATFWRVIGQGVFAV